nr:hypothetical protein Iba_chr08aCG10640 [Ipomoea batatas]
MCPVDRSSVVNFLHVLYMCSMSSGGSSPGHSDDVQVVDARPVGGRPAKARPTAPIQSTSSKAPPKKMEKVPTGEESSSRPKGKSTSKPKTTGGNNIS